MSENYCAGIPVDEITLANPFGAMYDLQRELQKRLGCLPYQYESPKAAAQKIIYWKHCVDAEILELLEWFDGRTGDTTWDELVKEVQMEAIDIVHFVFNVGVELNVTSTDLTMFDAAYDWPKMQLPLQASPIKDRAGELSISLLRLLNEMPWKAWKTYPDLPFEAYRLRVFELYKTVFTHTLDLCLCTGLTRQDIVNVYFAKNRENHRRQDNGY